ncbi:VOC family protein [Leucobacter denitrificans]|uniref:VOC family protein n=1 Tax=Leucobacter denitrificans TaxID=683042 RepID=A0A7G9S5D7_9MICO|nr:VOC family protein [Leucobacter denitrificans]QNN63062.1 VOC family protein [Leucobacter denitrificans]
MGLEVLDETETSVTLGLDENPLLLISEVAESAPVVHTDAGLYHSAILYPDAPALAGVLYNIATVAPASYGGSADHAVSLAFYFMDPDGNGLELYTDTPEDTWEWNKDGHVTMGSAPLDPNAFIQEHMGSTPSEEDTVMGHVHLKVGDLDDAREFYADTLGFDITAESEGAVFYSAGGYHHHLATNTWQSAGAGVRGADASGLGGFAIHLGDNEALASIADRLAAQNIEHTMSESVLTVNDPWGNTVRLYGDSA